MKTSKSQQGGRKQIESSKSTSPNARVKWISKQEKEDILNANIPASFLLSHPSISGGKTFRKKAKKIPQYLIMPSHREMDLPRTQGQLCQKIPLNFMFTFQSSAHLYWVFILGHPVWRGKHKKWPQSSNLTCWLDGFGGKKTTPLLNVSLFPPLSTFGAKRGMEFLQSSGIIHMCAKKDGEKFSPFQDRHVR